MTDTQTADMLRTTTAKLEESERQCKRAQRDLADAHAKLAGIRKSAQRSDAFAKIVFELRCYGLVFHVLDRDTPGSRPIPVVVPTSAFEQADPRSWPVVVEQTCKDAVAASRSVDFTPLDPDEREELALLKSQDELIRQEVGGDGEMGTHEGVRGAVTDLADERDEARSEATRLARELETMTAQRDKLLEEVTATAEGGDAEAALVEVAAKTKKGGKK